MSVQAGITSFNEMQREFIKYAADRGSILLKSPPGTGKTLATVGLWLFLRSVYGEACGKLLVVTQAKAMVAFEKANVKKRFLLKLKSAGDLSVFYSGYSWPAEIYLITPSLLTKLIFDGTAKQKRGLMELVRLTSVLAVDESHSLRNFSSKISKAFKKVSVYYHQLMADSVYCRRLLFITATPMYTALEDWYSIFSCLVHPNPLGSYLEFKNRYLVTERVSARGSKKLGSRNGSHSYQGSITFDKVVGYKNVNDLYARIDPYIFNWSKHDFTFNFHLRYFSLSGDERKAYNKALSGLGLDKSYIVHLDVDGSGAIVYRDGKDEFILPDGTRILTVNVSRGMRLQFNGVLATVTSIVDKKEDATYSVRVIRAQQFLSQAGQKVSSICDIVRSLDGAGCLVYCNFIDSVMVYASRLRFEFPGRRVVTLTGQTTDTTNVIQSLSKDSIVVMSQVASQSQDLYFSTLIIAECWGLTVGRLEQLVGRMTRDNASYRDVSVYFILRDHSVDDYFFERIRLGLRHSRSNTYTKALPPSRAIAGFSESVVDEKFLKEKLLWSRQ